MNEKSKEIEQRDKDLIDCAVKGEQRALSELLCHYQDEVYRFVLRQTGDKEQALELTQDVLVKVCKGLRGFRREASLKTWIMKIALNVCRNYFSSKAYRHSEKTTTLSTEEFEKIRSSDQESVFSAQAVKRLLEIVPRLKPIYRDAIVLCGLEKKTYKQAAEILEVPVGTVASRMNKALCLLREIYFEA